MAESTVENCLKNKKGHIRTFVMFDTETTGLPSPGNKPKITELCFIAITRDELLTKQRAPRVLQKLLVCFNPKRPISRESACITGLHNDALESLAFFKKQASILCGFLKNLPQPVCLIAHYGNGFDFRLLISELQTAEEQVPNILCADSLEAFRMFDGLPPIPEFVVNHRKAKTDSVFTHCKTGNDNEAESHTCGTKRISHDIECANELGNCKEPRLMQVWESTEITPVKSPPVIAVKKVNPEQHLNEFIETAPQMSLPAIVTNKLSTEHDSNKLTQSENSIRRQLFVTEMESDVFSDCDNQLKSESICQKPQIGCLPQEGINIVPASASDPTVCSDKTHNDLHQSTHHNSVVTVNKVTNISKNKDIYTKIVNMHTKSKVFYKLSSVYTRVFGQEPEMAHTAESDCQTLLKLVHNMSSKFPDWCDNYAVLLNTVKPMY